MPDIQNFPIDTSSFSGPVLTVPISALLSVNSDGSLDGDGLIIPLSVKIASEIDNIITRGSNGGLLVDGSVLGGGSSYSNDFLVEEAITQNAHGFSAKDVIYHDGIQWKKAKGDDSLKAAQAIVTDVADSDNFVICTFGRASISGHGFSVGSHYWLDQITDGLATSSKPTSGIVQPVFYVRDSDTIQVNIGSSTLINYPFFQSVKLGDQDVAFSEDGIVAVSGFNAVSSWGSDSMNGIDLDTFVFNESTGVLTLKKSGFYKFSYNLKIKAGSITRANIDSFAEEDPLVGSFSEIPGTRASTYLRNTDQDDGGLNASFIYRCSVPNTLIRISTQRDEATVPRTIVGSQSSFYSELVSPF